MWTNEPLPDDTPFPDDETLTRKMLGARGSAATAFGDKASLPDLWAAGVSTLAEH